MVLSAGGGSGIQSELCRTLIHAYINTEWRWRALHIHSDTMTVSLMCGSTVNVRRRRMRQPWTFCGFMTCLSNCYVNSFCCAKTWWQKKSMDNMQALNKNKTDMWHITVDYTDFKKRNSLVCCIKKTCMIIIFFLQ